MVLHEAVAPGEGPAGCKQLSGSGNGGRGRDGAYPGPHSPVPSSGCPRHFAQLPSSLSICHTFQELLVHLLVTPPSLPGTTFCSPSSPSTWCRVCQGGCSHLLNEEEQMVTCSWELSSVPPNSAVPVLSPPACHQVLKVNIYIIYKIFI